MESILLSIHPNDPLWIAIAFIFGFSVKLIGLPPLIGFLIAGFVLNAFGAESDEFLNTIADLGITLLLFSIGLKLQLRSLIRPRVWGVAVTHMLVITLVFALFTMALSVIGLPLLAGFDLQTSLLVGFVLSFSSTVFAIKSLDEAGAMASKHGQLAIGVLVIQDIAAVIFLAITVGKMPSIWAVLLLVLIPLKYILGKILDKTGHGELLVLFGIVLALLGADVFELVGIKGDVGALVLGMLLATHAKASELAKSLLSFKDLFLVGFFLSVGMTAMPGWSEVLLAGIFILLLPIKGFLFYALFIAFSLRTSTSWRASFNLNNFSEFGLIVGALAVSMGWLNKDWIAVFAIALSISFVVAAPLIQFRDHIYQLCRNHLKRFERTKRLPDDLDIDLSDTKIIIFGMGRMGTSAYKALEEDFPGHITGVELSSLKTREHQQAGRNVVTGDATNPEFWQRTKGLFDDLEGVMLTLPIHSANLAAVHQIEQLGYQGFIAATSQFADQQHELEEAGVDLSFNIYAEAGLGFAGEVKQIKSALKIN